MQACVRARSAPAIWYRNARSVGGRGEEIDRREHSLLETSSSFAGAATTRTAGWDELQVKDVWSEATRMRRGPKRRDYDASLSSRAPPRARKW